MMAKKQRRKVSRKFIPQANIVSDELYIPNHSGMLDAGKVHRTPTADLDPVNKKFVDDSIAAIPTPTLQTVTDAGATTDNDITLSSTSPEVQLYDTDGTAAQFTKTSIKQVGEAHRWDTETVDGGTSKTIITANGATDALTTAYDFTANSLKTANDITTTNGDVIIDGDNKKLLLGEDADASILYDGTDMVFDSQEVGTGDYIFNGNGDFNFDSTGEFRIGTAVDLGVGMLQIAKVGAPTQVTLDTYSNTASTNRPIYKARRSRGTTMGGMAVTLDGDNLGTFEFQGVGTANTFRQTAQMNCIQDGNSTATNVPAEYLFRLNDGGGLKDWWTMRADGTLQGFKDDQKIKLGEALDCSINYSGTGMEIKADDVGSGAVEILSDQVFVGSGTGLPYGHMYTNSTITVTITDTTPVEVGDTWTTGKVNLATFGASHYLTVTKAGLYKIEWGMSTAQNSPSAAIEIEGGIMIDGAVQNEGRAHRSLANGNDVGNFASTAIIDLAANKQISLYIKNETNGTDIDVEHANVSIVMVGGT